MLHLKLIVLKLNYRAPVQCNSLFFKQTVIYCKIKPVWNCPVSPPLGADRLIEETETPHLRPPAPNPSSYCGGRGGGGGGSETIDSDRNTRRRSGQNEPLCLAPFACLRIVTMMLAHPFHSHIEKKERKTWRGRGGGWRISLSFFFCFLLIFRTTGAPASRFLKTNEQKRKYDACQKAGRRDVDVAMRAAGMDLLWRILAALSFDCFKDSASSRWASRGFLVGIVL